MNAAARAIHWVEQGLVPDSVIRGGIRRLCRARLEEIDGPDCEAAGEAEAAFIDAMAGSPIAPLPEQANAQHYEVPAAFFDQVLGPAANTVAATGPRG
jgi:cyclopropane-fatty-acyl-phospholipid synthase